MGKNIISIEKLLQKPVCMMTGEELAFLINNIGLLTDRKVSEGKDAYSKPKISLWYKGHSGYFRLLYTYSEPYQEERRY